MFLQITRETLAVRKLANDLAKSGIIDASDVLASVSRCTRWPLLIKFHCSGTLYTDTSLMDLRLARRIKTKILAAQSLKPPNTSTCKEYADFLLKGANYKLETLRSMVTANMDYSGRRLCVRFFLCVVCCITMAVRIGRIMSAYVDDKIFSVELVGAVSSFSAATVEWHNSLTTRSCVKDRSWPRCMASDGQSPGFLTPRRMALYSNTPLHDIIRNDLWFIPPRTGI
jgi:hypothetical protein